MSSYPYSTPNASKDCIAVLERQWIYLGPILAAPLAHIAVSMYRHAKTPQQKKLVIWGGVVGSATFSAGMRLYLMYHAGYSSSGLAEEGSVQMVTKEAKKDIENPTVWKILSKAFKGFG